MRFHPSGMWMGCCVDNYVPSDPGRGRQVGISSGVLALWKRVVKGLGYARGLGHSVSHFNWTTAKIQPIIQGFCSPCTTYVRSSRLNLMPFIPLYVHLPLWRKDLDIFTSEADFRMLGGEHLWPRRRLAQAQNITMLKSLHKCSYIVNLHTVVDMVHVVVGSVKW